MHKEYYEMDDVDGVFTANEEVIEILAPAHGANLMLMVGSAVNSALSS
jgi:hypothetical protein